MFEKHHQQRIAAEIIDRGVKNMVIAGEKIEHHVFRAIGMDEFDILGDVIGEPIRSLARIAIEEGFGMVDISEMRGLEQGDLRRAERLGFVRGAGGMNRRCEAEAEKGKSGKSWCHFCMHLML